VIARRTFLKAGAAGLIGSTILNPTASISGSSETPLQLRAAQGQTRFRGDQKRVTQVMSYNQSIPGPLIRLQQGRESVIQFKNELNETSSVHWHGLRIDNAMDGVPGMTQAAVLPGDTFEYRFTPPDAGTYWYHSHQRSWAQLALGLAGVLIVDEEEPPFVDQDLVFAIDDWRLDDAMQIDTQSLGSLHDWSHGGRMGNVITVNGETEKRFNVASGERIRLRLINIANARTMNLLFNEPGISVIAVDGQPVRPFTVDTGGVILAPGQRMDLIIDMTADPGHRSLIELVIGEYAYEVASFEFADTARRKQLPDTPIALSPNPLSKTVLPDKLVHIPLLMEGGAMGGMRSATFGGREMEIRELIKHNKIWAINGIAGMPEKPLFSVKRGTAISLDVNNDNSWPHAMHIHGHHFIYDKTPEYWRDTALFSRGEQGSMAFVADNPGKWLIHCHMVEHMAGGMVTWFEVT
jgi:FtsP/CotA-like multicopper oxidase with cupredoxin domain